MCTNLSIALIIPQIYSGTLKRKGSRILGDFLILHCISYSTPLSFIHLGLLVVDLTIFVPILEQCAILKFESVNILHPLHVPNRSTSRFIELRETLGI